ncbi:MAG: hypothetical protein V4690_03260, partial [Patescibacteria group bacterium]
MTKLIGGCISLTLVFTTLLGAYPTTAYSASGVPAILSYQGRLTNSLGDLVGGSGTTYYFKFSIWDNSTVGSGTKLWPSSAPSSFGSTVRQGVFNVNIGDTAGGYPDTLDYNFNTNKDVYLQIEVSSNNSTFETLSPRQRVSSAPFAQVAGSVSGTGQSSFGTTTPVSNAVVTIESTSTNSIPNLIRAFVGQVANLFEIENSSGDSLFSINNNGGVFASSTLQVTGDSNFYGNLIANVLNVTGTSSSTFAGGIETSAGLDLNNGFIFGAGLQNCNGAGDKLIWNSGTGKFGCGTDAGGAGSGISSILAEFSPAQTGGTQTLATTSDTNIGLTITSNLDTHTFT